MDDVAVLVFGWTLFGVSEPGIRCKWTHTPFTLPSVAYSELRSREVEKPTTRKEVNKWGMQHIRRNTKQSDHPFIPFYKCLLSETSIGIT